MAAAMSLAALSIDAMLPALGDIGRELGTVRENDAQLVVSLFLLGFAVGQVAWGPFADSFGRKFTLLSGLALYLVGSFVCFQAESFPLMLAGRLIQGLGVASPRIVSIAIIRDQFEGRQMARVMSFIMAVFVIVPIIAPAFGQTLLLFGSWRLLFGIFGLFAIVLALWFSLRQPETLPVDRRVPFSLRNTVRGIGHVLRVKSAFAYTIAAGLVFGSFIGYLSSAQQIFQVQYQLGKLFPVYFGVLAVAIGVASIANTGLVIRHGMRRLVGWSLRGVLVLSLGFLVLVVLPADGHPPVWALMAYLLVVFFGIGLLFGNMNALAMEELGDIAGVGAGVVGSLSMLISIACGTAVSQSYNGTVLPLIVGFAVLAGAALATTRWAAS